MRLIQTEFPGWRVWRSDTGRWWAFRTSAKPLTIKQLRAGCRLTVPAATGVALRAAVRAEIAAARRAARRSCAG
ncbi:MAG TPA: hypothetical protein VH912_24925 [Streptosporangiaceae bacterium]